MMNEITKEEFSIWVKKLVETVRFYGLDKDVEEFRLEAEDLRKLANTQMQSSNILEVMQNLFNDTRALALAKGLGLNLKTVKLDLQGE